MHAIEFEADARDRIIEIPEQYKEFSNKHLKIVLMIDEPQPGESRKPGSAKERVRISDDFENPLPWEEVKDFYGE
ncbi:MAG: hypothetical protein GF344_05960 [Chitinivibrionales bacterium]|nr:hypothetical protein [Chitinivibrionales bacterium]